MVAFVILHYNDINITLECIDHLLKLNSINDSKIIVVDNCSPNESGKILQERFKSDELIDIVLSPRNLGFAKGNNMGYVIAKKYDPNYIVVMNNDVLIQDRNFINSILDNADANKYEVILPDIINKSGFHQNPYKVKADSDVQIVKTLLLHLLLCIIYYMPLINIIWSKRKDKRSAKSAINSGSNIMLIPHGACVIYSAKWIKKENIAFVPETFMYGEEEILFEYMINKEYKSIFFAKCRCSSFRRCCN